MVVGAIAGSEHPQREWRAHVSLGVTAAVAHMVAAAGARAKLWTKDTVYFSSASSAGTPDWVEYSSPAFVADCEPHAFEKHDVYNYYFIRVCIVTSTDAPASADGAVYAKSY